ncbi:MAG: hypothetical protein EBR67_11350 [Proteobacteria bacterium]|nr:hypothetical protein [Pseudomonadota bacterium]
MTINIVQDMDQLIGLNLRDSIEYIESKLSYCYEIVAKDNVLGEYGFACGEKYHKPFKNVMYIDIITTPIKRIISLHFNPKTGLIETYRITCKK